jgi:thymidine phosphorylase
MSKKIAEGIDALVLDVKAGRGAFMKTEADARRLAESLVSIGRAAGVQTEAVLTAMEAPLGRAVGNAVEVIESIEVLKGRGPADLIEVSLELAARMLVLGGVARDRRDADRLLRGAVASGAGVERLRRIVETQGGDPAVVDDYSRLPSAPNRHVVRAARGGYVSGLDAALIGRASVALGAGRNRVEDRVDPAVGIMILARPGDEIRAGEGVLELHYRERDRLEAALGMAGSAIAVGDARVPAVPLVLGHIG